MAHLAILCTLLSDALLGVAVGGVLLLFLLAMAAHASTRQMPPMPGPRVHVVGAAQPLPLSAESVLALLATVTFESLPDTLDAAVFEVDLRGWIEVVRSTGPEAADPANRCVWAKLAEPAARCIRTRSRVEWITLHPVTGARWSCIAEPLTRGDRVVARIVGHEIPALAATA